MQKTFHFKRNRTVYSRYCKICNKVSSGITFVTFNIDHGHQFVKRRFYAQNNKRTELCEGILTITF